MMNSAVIFPRAQSHVFGLKILKFFDTDLGSGMDKIRIPEKCPRLAQMVT
jgi:hypothetical protein